MVLGISKLSPKFVNISVRHSVYVSQTFSFFYLSGYHDGKRYICDQCSVEYASMSSLRKHTGKSLSEALIFASTNPQYENRLFME